MFEICKLYSGLAGQHVYLWSGPNSQLNLQPATRNIVAEVDDPAAFSRVVNSIQSYYVYNKIFCKLDTAEFLELVYENGGNRIPSDCK